MQVQVFRNAAEMLGNKVLKVDLTAVVADSEGKALAGKKVRFLLDDKMVAEAVTSESGEARTGSVLVELPEHHGTTITVILEGYAIRGQSDFADVLGRKTGQSATSNRFTPAQAAPEAPKYEIPQGLDPVKNKMLYHFLWGTAGMFLGSHLFLFCVILIHASSNSNSRVLENLGAIVLTGVVLGGIGFIVVSMILLYRHWESLQVESITISPGQAVGFLFIPFFNCYWAFIAIYGLARDYNRILRQHGISAPLASENTALAAAILFCISLVSCGYLSLFALATLGTFLLQLRKTAEAVYAARQNG